MTYNNQKGQSIVEMLVATSAVVVALLGILSLINRSLGLNRVNADSYTATYLAEEGIELVKNFFDQKYLEASASSPKPDFYGWGQYGIQTGVYEADYDDSSLTDSGSSNCLTPPSGEPTKKDVEDLLFSGCGKFLNFDGNYYLYDGTKPETKFIRLIIIDDPIGDGLDLEYRVTSAVGWISRGGKFVVQLQDHFLPWRVP